MCLFVPHAIMEPFEGLDFYDIESLLTEEEIMIRDMVRDWVDEEVLPKIEHACEEGVFPCLLYTSPSPRDLSTSRMPSSA